MAVTRTFTHSQHPSCYRLSCEMQLNLANPPQACRPELRNSRRCSLMGYEVLLFCILLEVLGIMTHGFPDVRFSLYLSPQTSEQGEEDNKSSP